MNGHFVYFPPGVVFPSPGPSSPTNFPTAQLPVVYAQYGVPASPSSQHGAYPVYSYPPPHIPPHMNPNVPPFVMRHQYSTPPAPGYPVNDMLYQSSQNPQRHVAPGSDHDYNHANIPEHPPGLPIAHRALQPPATPGPSPPREHIEIHDCWKGRLAPLPGYRSEKTLPPMREVTVVEQEVGASMTLFGVEFQKPPTVERKLNVLKNGEKNMVIHGFILITSTNSKV